MRITLYTSACADRQLQVLLPDGQPGVGVLINSSYLHRASFLTMRTQPLHHRVEDAAAYTNFAKNTWPFGQLTTDSKGRVTLPNLPKCQLNLVTYWPLPGTDFLQMDQPKLTVSDDPSKPLTVRLIGKP
jgi:hypothetical protein